MKLIFVYNADGGVLNVLKDGLHKIAAPASYPCALCALTYGLVRERPRWRQFHDASPHEMVFLHRDAFEAHYGVRAQYPLVLAAFAEQLTPVVTRAELEKMEDVGELIAVVSDLAADEIRARPSLFSTDAPAAAKRRRGGMVFEWVIDRQ